MTDTPATPDPAASGNARPEHSKPTSLSNALERLEGLRKQAQAHGLTDASAATLATASGDGRPSARIIYILRIDDSGPAFLISTNSGKARQLQENPQAALCFFWPGLQEQVSIEGSVAALDDERSDALWRRRLRDDQVGAWAAEARATSTDTTGPQDAMHAWRKHFREQPVPRPAHWRGFVLRPDYLRFWSTGWHRIQSPVLYRKDENGQWTVQEIPL